MAAINRAHNKAKRPSAQSIAAVLLGLAGMTLGCRRDELPTAPVHGRVSYNQSPLQLGLIIFEPAQGPVATAAIDAEGNYELGTFVLGDGAVLGAHRVYLLPPDQPSPGESAPGIPLPRPPAPPFVPARYRNPATSGLQAVVKRGANRFNFDLSDDQP